VQDGLKGLAKYPYDPKLEGMYKDVVFPKPKTYADGLGKGMPAFLEKTLNRTREGPDFSPPLFQETMKALYRLISGVDIEIGKILSVIKEMGAEEETVIVFNGDNGSYYGEHGLGGKWLMHEESIRVPLIVCDPRLGKEARGQKRDEMSLNIDICPTILETAGIEAPKGVQGRNLRPIVEGKSVPWRHEWFYEHLFRGAAIAPSEGIRTDRWKYIRYVDEKPEYEELYDLETDKFEEKNLVNAAEGKEMLEKLRGRWGAWRKSLEAWKPGQAWSEPA
jgi:arylsulfatase A-like enzyme